MFGCKEEDWTIGREKVHSGAFVSYSILGLMVDWEVTYRMWDTGRTLNITEIVQNCTHITDLHNSAGY